MVGFFRQILEGLVTTHIPDFVAARIERVDRPRVLVLNQIAPSAVRPVAGPVAGADDDDVLGEKQGFHHGARIVEQLTALPWPNDVFMNVNFPNRNPKEVSGVNVVAQGRQDAGYDIQERIDPRSNSYFWIGPAVRNGIRVGDTDYQALERGEISITPLHMDLTHHEALEQMKGAFS